jgi:hypothetical protein
MPTFVCTHPFRDFRASLNMTLDPDTKGGNRMFDAGAKIYVTTSGSRPSNFLV